MMQMAITISMLIEAYKVTKQKNKFNNLLFYLVMNKKSGINIKYYHESSPCT